MKESIGGTQIFMIVVVLIILFSAIMALTINHSNAFAVKDQIITVLEKNNGFDMTADLSEKSNEELEEITELLAKNSYRATGRCPEDDPETGITVTGYERDGRRTVGNNRSSFCIVKVPTNTGIGTVDGFYYKVVVFYTLDIPIIKSIVDLKVVGETKLLYKDFNAHNLKR